MRLSASLSCFFLVLLAKYAPAGDSLNDDLTALEGVWSSKAVKDADRRGSGIIKLQFKPAKDGVIGGRGSLEIKTKRGGSSSSSTRTFSFKLIEKDGKRTIVAPGPRGAGVSLVYRLQGDRLLLTGEVASGRVTYNLQNVPLRRTAR